MKVDIEFYGKVKTLSEEELETRTSKLLKEEERLLEVLK